MSKYAYPVAFLAVLAVGGCLQFFTKSKPSVAAAIGSIQSPTTSPAPSDSLGASAPFSEPTSTPFFPNGFVRLADDSPKGAPQLDEAKRRYVYYRYLITMPSTPPGYKYRFADFDFKLSVSKSTRITFYSDSWYMKGKGDEKVTVLIGRPPDFVSKDTGQMLSAYIEGEKYKLEFIRYYSGNEMHAIERESLAYCKAEGYQYSIYECWDTDYKQRVGLSSAGFFRYGKEFTADDGNLTLLLSIDASGNKTIRISLDDVPQYPAGTTIPMDVGYDSDSGYLEHYQDNMPPFVAENKVDIKLDLTSMKFYNIVDGASTSIIFRENENVPDWDGKAAMLGVVTTNLITTHVEGTWLPFHAIWGSWSTADIEIEKKYPTFVD